MNQQQSLTARQQQAIEAIRAALDLMPPPGTRLSPELARAWLTAIRPVLQQIADAFPQGEQP